MASYVLIHGAADSGWFWHLLEAELRARGHEVVAPDLPCDTTRPAWPSTPTRWSAPSATAPA
jgi:pimeloyl-ACP methyl ester carboxylesterase